MGKIYSENKGLLKTKKKLNSFVPKPIGGQNITVQEI